MTELQIVNKEQAEKLKKLGFNWECQSYYIKRRNKNTATLTISSKAFDFNAEDACYFSAPTVALALKWIRDVKKVPNAVNFWDVVSWEYEGSYQVCNIIDTGDKRLQPRTTYNTKSSADYGIAESALLDELLNILEK